MGGTSSINAAGAVWPRIEDFGELAALGKGDWSWGNVKRWLRRIEADTDATDAARHGRDGPISIRRYQERELIRVQRAFSEACQTALAIDPLADHNEVGIVADGVGPWPMNRRADGTRISTALAYLSPARGRQNLEVRGQTTVARLVFEAGRAVGVEQPSGDTLRARRGVILCAGALGTPAILMRSGIGSGEHLAALGIAPLLDRPGVGARLWDHSSVPVRLLPKAGQCNPQRDPRFQMLARLTSPSGAPLMLVPVSFLDISPFPTLQMQPGGAPVVTVISAGLMRPRGHGQIRLVSSDPHTAPEIDLNFCVEVEDLSDLREGVRLAWRVADAPHMQREIAGVVGLDQELVGSDERIDEYVRANVGSFSHPCGTAPMGRKDDPLAVTDQHGCVRGVDGLWIADASLMPRGVSVPPNLTTIMIGERIAAWLRRNKAGSPTQ